MSKKGATFKGRIQGELRSGVHVSCVIRYEICTPSNNIIQCVIHRTRKNEIELSNLIGEMVRVTGEALYFKGNFVPTTITLIDKVEKVEELTTDPFESLKGSIDLGDELPHEYANRERKGWDK